MNNFSFDKFGCVCQKNGDGGDTLARTGLYGFLTGECNVEALRVFPGAYVRSKRHNPSTPPAKSWDDPTDTSRDQYVAPICFYSRTGDKERTQEISTLLLDNWLRFPNGDLAGPDVWSLLLRGLNKYRFLVYVLDLWFIPSVLVRCWQGSRDPNDVGDDINLTTMLLHNSLTAPTFFTRLSCLLYGKLRQPGGVQRAWDWYFRPETFANPFNELARSLIARFLS